MKRKLLMTASTYSHIRNFHLPYLREFQRLGWETHVGCADIPVDTPYIDEAIELPFEKRMRSSANFRATHILRKRIEHGTYDLIITHTSLAAFFTRLAVKGMKVRPKLINVVHGYLFDDDMPAWKRQILLNAERLTTPETDLLLTMNQYDFELAQQYRLGDRIEQIPGMGVDFSRLDAATPEDGLQLREELGVAKDAFVLLYAAEFSKRKSQHVLIEAMKYLPENVVLVLCGEGTMLQNCKALAKRLYVDDRVLFPGQVEGMGAWYRMADVAVTSSRSEGLPFNVMEAMYMGLPVVASAVKGHVDLIADGETGLLFPYGNAGACAELVRRLIGDAASWKKMQELVRSNALQYEIDTVLPLVIEQYLSLLEKKEPGNKVV